jgi:hypothetical protein
MADTKTIYVILPKGQDHTVSHVIPPEYTQFGRIFFESPVLAKNWLEAHHADCIESFEIVPCTLQFGRTFTRTSRQWQGELKNGK